MTARWSYPVVAVAALAAGSALWIATRPAALTPASTSAPSIAPAAMFATPFSDTEGRPQSLGQYQGRIVVLNFWATWCAPCREEMPAFTRLQARWASRGVQFVGVSSEEAAKAARFGRDLGVNYPLWIGDGAGELSRRLGNSAGVLPHSVVLDASGKVLEQKVGPYREEELDRILAKYVAKAQ
jgi:thiol-disulfide isomerase/thioredoxin